MFWSDWSPKPQRVPPERPAFVIRQEPEPPSRTVDMEVWRCHFRDAADEALAELSPSSHDDTMRPLILQSRKGG